MTRIVRQVLGIVVIVVFVGGWWLLDLYGCAFNTAGCNRILPRVTLEAVAVLVVPVGLGLLLILAGRRLR